MRLEGLKSLKYTKFTNGVSALHRESFPCHQSWHEYPTVMADHLPVSISLIVDSYSDWAQNGTLHSQLYGQLHLTE